MFAKWFNAYPLLILAKQQVLSVKRIYFLLVHKDLKVYIAIVIAINSLILISIIAGFNCSLHKKAVK